MLKPLVNGKMKIELNSYSLKQNRVKVYKPAIYDRKHSKLVDH